MSEELVLAPTGFQADIPPALKQPALLHFRQAATRPIVVKVANYSSLRLVSSLVKFCFFLGWGGVAVLSDNTYRNNECQLTNISESQTIFLMLEIKSLESWAPGSSVVWCVVTIKPSLDCFKGVSFCLVLSIKSNMLVSLVLSLWRKTRWPAGRLSSSHYLDMRFHQISFKSFSKFSQYTVGTRCLTQKKNTDCFTACKGTKFCSYSSCLFVIICSLLAFKSYIIQTVYIFRLRNL